MDPPGEPDLGKEMRLHREGEWGPLAPWGTCIKGPLPRQDFEDLEKLSGPKIGIWHLTQTDSNPVVIRGQHT